MSSDALRPFALRAGAFLGFFSLGIRFFGRLAMDDDVADSGMGGIGAIATVRGGTAADPAASSTAADVVASSG